jgi:uncharacterized protein YceK
MIKNLMIILILTLSLSHCSSINPLIVVDLLIIGEKNER